MATKNDTNTDTKDDGTTRKDASDEKQEAQLEDLIDKLGTEPSKEGSKEIALDDPAALDGVSAQKAPNGGEIKPDDVVPDVAPDLLDNPGDAAGLPREEHPDSSDNGSVDGDHEAFDGPADTTDIDPSELGLEETGPTLDDAFLDDRQGTGGLDGRNPADNADSGNPADGLPAETDPNDPLATTGFDTSHLANPYFGAGFDDGSAAGAYTPGQQAVLKDFAARTQAALDAGDAEEVASLNEQTQHFLEVEGLKDTEEPAISMAAALSLVPLMPRARAAIFQWGTTTTKASSPPRARRG